MMALFCCRFVGVYYRPRNEVHLFEKGIKHGRRGASVQVLPWGDPSLQEIIADDLFQQLQVCVVLTGLSHRITMPQCDRHCMDHVDIISNSD